VPVSTPDGAGLSDLPLREYLPRSRLQVPEHHVAGAAVAAVDAHAHLGRWRTGGRWAVADLAVLLDLMDACNVAAVVNMDGCWGDELEANLDRYDRRHPGRFATFCHVDWAALAGPRPQARLVASLERSVSTGACGLKVWKDLGLHVRDGDGRLVLPDDRRLDPLWDKATELGVPVAIHTADPVAFFDPLDRHNERLEELLAHPEWRFAAPGFPPFARLVEALEATVAAHPATTFIGAHAGCYAENLAWVSRMLDAYPNFHIDISARIAELGRQPRAMAALVRAHPDRVLFGSDRIPPDRRTYEIYFRFLETADEHFPYAAQEPPPYGRWAISGVELPAEVLAAVYAGNSRRLLPRWNGSRG
jgi:predicted TIM-barrel fold metal-dependent hydrolase